MELTEGSCGSGDELMRAQTILWSHIFNHIDSMSLKCAVELKIPEAIHSHGKPIILSELISAISIPPIKEPHLRRLMRVLTHSGVFARSNGTDEDNEDMYALTPLSSLLIEKKDPDLSKFLLAMLHPVIVNPFESMSTWFKSDDSHVPTPFSTFNGFDFWEMTQRNPKFSKVFNEGMASDSKFVMNFLLTECREVFEGVNSLVDVGGGTGLTAIMILEEFPDMWCSVLELPQVIDGVNKKGGVDFVAGNMFDYIPPADSVLLKWILHGWSDEECVKILKRCKEAIPRDGGKVIIIDIVVGSKSCYEKSSEAQFYFDMLMMVVSGGVERSEKEWRNLFIDAGFMHYTFTPALVCVQSLKSILDIILGVQIHASTLYISTVCSTVILTIYLAVVWNLI